MSISNGDEESSNSSPVEMDNIIEHDFSSLDGMPEEVSFAIVFGRWMKQERERRSLSQREVAVALGRKSQSNVSEYEQGLKNIGIESIDVLLKTYDVSVSAMLIGMLAMEEQIRKEPRAQAPAPKGSRPHNIDASGDPKVTYLDPGRVPAPNEVLRGPNGDKPGDAPAETAKPPKPLPLRPSPKTKK